jgi:uncharacterized iron-regulated membrane protein
LKTLPLHFDDYGGMPIKILWALFDLLTIVVLVSGLYLWLKKRNVPIALQLNEIDGEANAETRSAARKTP